MKKIQPYIERLQPKEWGTKEVKTWELWKSLMAEFLGTAFLVLIGCGSALRTLSYVGIAFAFGLIVGIMVQTMGHISGGHINPAVTLGMLVTGNISIVAGVLYVVSQLLGAIAGALILFLLMLDYNTGALGATSVSTKLSDLQGIGIEFLTTFVLVFTVFSVTDPARPEQKALAPTLIGLSVAAGHLWAIPYTGPSMNTARSFGPSVIMNQWETHWVYWVGPPLGGIVAALLYKFFFSEQPIEEQEEVGLSESNVEEQEEVSKN